LAIYDPHQRKVLSHWTETHKYQKLETHTDQRTGKPFEKRVESIAQLRLGPVPSRDGSRLFAISEGDITVWDSQTLQELARFEAPELPAEAECFYAAPDGHGMWFISKAGTVYRLDGQTGKVTETIKLPLRLFSLIRER
jgi:WD40 repeat protein